MALTVRLKRKLFARARSWEDLANTYEQCLRNPGKDENEKIMRGIERLFPKETAAFKEKLKNNSSYTTNNGRSSNNTNSSWEDWEREWKKEWDERRKRSEERQRKAQEEFRKWEEKLRKEQEERVKRKKAAEEEAKKYDQNFKNEVNSEFEKFDKKTRKDTISYMKSMQKRKKLAKIGGIGAGIAAAAGLGYGLKKSFDEVNDWEKEKKKIHPVSPTGEKLSRSKISYYKGKETNSQKQARDSASTSITTLGGVGGVGIVGGLSAYKQNRLDNLYKKKDRRLMEKEDLLNNISQKYDKNARSFYDRYNTSMSGLGYSNNIFEKRSSLNAAYRRYLNNRVGKHLRRNLAIGGALGIVGGGMLAGIYKNRTQVRNERMNSKKRLEKLQSS